MKDVDAESLSLATRLLSRNWPTFTPEGLAACFGTRHNLYPVKEVHVAQIKPFRRVTGVVGIHEHRAESLIDAFSQASEVPPIVVEWTNREMEFELRDGFHRYYLAVAAGCHRIRVAVMPRHESAA